MHTKTLGILVIVIVIGAALLLALELRKDEVKPPVESEVLPTEESRDVSLEEKVGQMLLVGIRGDTVTEETRSLLADVRPGGILLFDRDIPSGGEITRNITSPEQLQSFTANLQNESPTPLFIAADIEGGYVNRLKKDKGFDITLPPAQTMGSEDIASTTSHAEELADILVTLGINTDLAPVVDVNINPDSAAIGYLERSFSADPEKVSEYAEAFIAPLHAQNIVTSLKHFPGHGSAKDDSHLGMTDVTDTYDQEKELQPYRTLLADGYTDPIMTAHIVNQHLDEVPATLSHAILTGILREELEFDGVIISDDMQMGAIVEHYGLEEASIAAVNAGVDLLIIANQVGDYDPNTIRIIRDAIVEAVQNGEISNKRIDESYRRITELKERREILE